MLSCFIYRRLVILSHVLKVDYFSHVMVHEKEMPVFIGGSKSDGEVGA